MYIIILKTLMLNISVMLNIKFFISIQIRKKGFCDVKYQFFFIFIFFANLKKKKISVMSNIKFWERYLQYDMLWRIWKLMYICIKANAACITNWQKKREREGEKRLYICLQLLKDKKHQTLTKVSWQPVSLT